MWEEEKRHQNSYLWNRNGKYNNPIDSLIAYSLFPCPLFFFFVRYLYFSVIPFEHVFFSHVSQYWSISQSSIRFIMVIYLFIASRVVLCDSLVVVQVFSWRLACFFPASFSCVYVSNWKPFYKFAGDNIFQKFIDTKNARTDESEKIQNKAKHSKWLMDTEGPTNQTECEMRKINIFALLPSSGTGLFHFCFALLFLLRMYWNYWRRFSWIFFSISSSFSFMVLKIHLARA